MGGSSVVGALVAAKWGETLPRFRTYVIAFLICGAPRYVVMALDSPLWAVFAITVVAGVASGFLNPILGAVIMERIPAPLLGRVSSLNTAICWSLMPLGGVLGGLLVAGLGISPALLVAGVAYLVTTMAPTRVPSFRRMDRAPATPPARVPSGV
jgi:predicted MFS family arabinose efflux permease